MRQPLHRRRPAVTLIEVLVAIFVMALGLLTLLALFPLGVLTMAQAIQDDRTSNAAANATALAIAMDLRHDSAILGNPPLFPNLFQNPNPLLFTDAPADGPSYPVYVDPLGARSYFGLYAQWIGGQLTGGVPRSPVSFVNSTQSALQSFTLLDDLQFDTAGLPNQVANNLFERDNRYSYAYLLRRPLTADPTVVELTVVAYSQRPLALNSSLQGDEAVFTGCTFDASSNVVSISWNPNIGQAAPNIRVGGWILDATAVPSPNQAAKFTPPHAFFYRVVGVTETSDTSMDVEVQTAIRGVPAGQTQFSGTVVVMEGVAEVFEKGTGWHP